MAHSIKKDIGAGKEIEINMRNGKYSSYKDESANTCLNDKNKVSNNRESDATPSLRIIPFGDTLKVDEKDIKGIQGGFL